MDSTLEEQFEMDSLHLRPESWYLAEAYRTYSEPSPIV